MLEKQERDAPSAPVMPEVAVHHDGGLRRPAREADAPGHGGGVREDRA